MARWTGYNDDNGNGKTDNDCDGVTDDDVQHVGR